MSHEEAIKLLQRMIAIPSISQTEEGTAEVLAQFLQTKDVEIHRLKHNVWARNKFYDAAKPTILLNSHHDTVKPNKGYTKGPFQPEIIGQKLFGLGSNDAGGCLVALIGAFLHFYDQENLSHNLVLVASAEEEISGKNGISAVLPLLGKIDCGIVGEPTQMQMAIAEKGLMVLDITVRGEAGHAAREEGRNAIYEALQDIAWFQNATYERASSWLGPIKMTVTQIEAGRQHNIVPELCRFVVDVRSTDVCSHKELLHWIKSQVRGEVKARSTRLNPSFINPQHPLVKAGDAMGLEKYGSPTLSDQALMPFPTLKMGPGDSARSHMADEFIFLSEIKEGIDGYIKILDKVMIKK